MMYTLYHDTYFPLFGVYPCFEGTPPHPDVFLYRLYVKRVRRRRRVMTFALAKVQLHDSMDFKCLCLHKKKMII